MDIPATHPHHIFDRLLWPALRLLWEPISRKNSHWWHWQNYSGQVPQNAQPYEDQGAGPGRTIWQRFWQTNIGWKNALIISPKNFSGPYKLGFATKEEKKICSIIITGPVAVLLGPVPTTFFGQSYPHNEEIELVKSSIQEKNGLPPSTLLL